MLGTFHHIGIACDSIATARQQYVAIGYLSASPVVADPAQGVSVQFLEGGGPRLELVEPLEDSTTLRRWLDSPARMYHLAYEVVDLAGSLETARTQRAVTVRPPLAAPAFDGRHVAFVMYPGRVLIEFVQADVIRSEDGPTS